MTPRRPSRLGGLPRCWASHHALWSAPCVGCGIRRVPNPCYPWPWWLGIWAVLGAVGLVWMQPAWGPCWKAGADYGLTAGARIALMATTGGALLLPFLLLNVALDTVWFLYGLFLAPYVLLMGLLGGTALAPSGTVRPWPFLVRITVKRPTRRKDDASAAALCMVG